MVTISIASDPNHPDRALAAQLSRELPGFWDYFIQRHPEFISTWSSKAPECLMGRLDVLAIHEAMGETIAAYVAEFGCGHASSCAVHNAPALPVGECDCEGPLTGDDALLDHTS